MNQMTADFSRYGFLVADDKAFLRNTIQSMLMRCRVGTVAHASNGAEAMKVLAESDGTIDCVLCDWNMAPVDGLELLRSIRTGSVHQTLRDLRVIMPTGHSDDHLVKSAMALDASGYVVKPVSMVKLIDAVGRAFAKPTALKPAAVYRAIGLVDLPDVDLHTAAKRIPPWVVWSGMRSGERRKWAERLEQVRHDTTKLPPSPTDAKRPLVNRQRMDLASIPDGKVLAEDIYAEDGHLLLAIGTPLTHSLIGRLRELADDSAVKAQLIVGDFGD